MKPHRVITSFLGAVLLSSALLFAGVILVTVTALFSAIYHGATAAAEGARTVWPTVRETWRDILGCLLLAGLFVAALLV